jgi:hypothetical protein
MIIVKLIGGLGNQMFQYAAARHLSLLHKTDLFFDIASFENNNNAYTKRNFELDVFNLNFKFCSNEMLNDFNIHSSTKISRVLQRNFPYLFKKLYAAESGINYQKQFLKFPKNTYLDGFWQSELYFNSIKSVIIKDFEFTKNLDDKNFHWLNLIQSTNSVSIHVRRGDYITNVNAQSYNGSLGLEYYENAFKFIKSKFSDVLFFVFSDDIEWCEKNINTNTKTFFIDSNKHSNFHLDMYLMSQCKHNIIANSSFSWWAAWLNQNNNKCVVAPKKWFAISSLDTSDLIPKSWITL